jgi:hypothetical protein
MTNNTEDTKSTQPAGEAAAAAHQGISMSPGEKVVWQRATEHMAHECERLFQNGGPKVYELWRDGSRELTPTHLSATRVARNLSSGGAVFARRKVNGGYQWMCVVKRPERIGGQSHE